VDTGGPGITFILGLSCCILTLQCKSTPDGHFFSRSHILQALMLLIWTLGIAFLACLHFILFCGSSLILGLCPFILFVMDSVTNLTGSIITKDASPQKWEVGRPMLNVGGTISWAVIQDCIKKRKLAEHQYSCPSAS
jgi:Ca2+/Na+ antiporter